MSVDVRCEVLIHRSPAQVFDFMIGDHIRAGRLLEVLGPFAAEGPAIHALFLASQRRSPKIRAFIDFLGEAFAPGG